MSALSQVRGLMKNYGPLQAYIVPWTDAHNSEYLAECDRQRAILSGFTGTAGTAIVTESQACVWTDGRYYLQASKEMDSNWTLMKQSLPDTPTEYAWLCSTLPPKSNVGVDFSLIEHKLWKTLHDNLQSAGHSLVPTPQGNGLVEQVWKNRSTRPNNQVNVLPEKFAGKSPSNKIKEVRQAMTKHYAKAFVVSALDEIAWVLNLRGSDIPFNPVFFSFLVITQESLHLFIEASRLSSESNKLLSELNCCIHPYENIYTFVGKLVSTGNEENGRIWFGTTANRALTASVPEKSFFLQCSPIALMKAIKNSTEIQGMRQAHIRDGVAVSRYFHWLENAIKEGKKVTEASGATQLEKFRSEMEHFVGPSFDTISSVGSNGAIIHYQPSKEGSELDLQITNNAIYLCDSGGQYLDGTTDITRTIHLGTPSSYEKECFTRVLKGQIMLSTAVFPYKIPGNYLDTLARKFLWDVGKNYQHGTGHGIGSYLNVHEGPMGISWRAMPDDPGLQPGMFLSNEPGYYENGKFGVRIENIECIVESKVSDDFCTFETITLVPIQTKMIARDLLTDQERMKINEYHKLCREKLSPLLHKGGHLDVVQWLNEQTQPI